MLQEWQLLGELSISDIIADVEANAVKLFGSLSHSGFVNSEISILKEIHAKECDEKKRDEERRKEAEVRDRAQRSNAKKSSGENSKRWRVLQDGYQGKAPQDR